jgi:8-oxo-dGTP pyrophosphatase MutT (NUDIX family)
MELVARGPWRPEAVRTRWLDEPFALPPADRTAADEALADLGRRGSPSHEGVSARLAGVDARQESLQLTVQRAPWSARLLPDKHNSLAVVCIVRAHDGRWLAGRRSAWLAIRPGEWMLGGAGGVEADEDPVRTMAREVVEEWSLEPDRLSVDALVRTGEGFIWLVGQAWVPADAQPVLNDEHDGWAWWPPSPDDWPPEASGELRELGRTLG